MFHVFFFLLFQEFFSNRTCSFTKIEFVLGPSDLQIFILTSHWLSAMAALHESIKAMSIDDDEQHYIGWLIYSPHFLEDGTKSYEKTHKS